MQRLLLGLNLHVVANLQMHSDPLAAVSSDARQDPCGSSDLENNSRPTVHGRDQDPSNSWGASFLP